MKNGMNANDIEKTTFFVCVSALFLFFFFFFFFLSSRAYIIDKHLSLIDIIPIFAAAVFELCFNELLDDAIKIVWYSNKNNFVATCKF